MVHKALERLSGCRQLLLKNRVGSECAVAFDLPRNQCLIHDAPAEPAVDVVSEEFASPLEAPASSAERVHRSPTAVRTASAHKQTIAAEQRTIGPLEWASREFLRAIACDTEQRHCAFCFYVESNGQPRLAARELRIETAVRSRKLDACAYCNCT